MGQKWKWQGTQIEQVPLLRALLERQLSPDTKARLSAVQVLKHTWITDGQN